jgi:hypothetical protein
MNSAAITVLIIIVALIAILVGVAVWQRSKTRKLRARFGHEYDRVVGQEHGNRARAETILDQREQRIRKFHIRRLSSEESGRFAADWRRVQELFVDDPRGALARADTLVTEALTACGYPMGDFEQRAADLSVDHPDVVENYRFAHDIVMQREATTEDLRGAMQHYRRLFEDILDIHVSQREEVHR